MQPKTHWIFDNFFSNAPRLRSMIDDHFNEALALKKPFSNRTIWNFWFIDRMYIYFRTIPEKIFFGEEKGFVDYLNDFTARSFGLKAPSSPLLSMYTSGCGQELHNDAKNGRLAYVFSLTNWDKKHFDGGETVIHRFDEELQLANMTRPAAGEAFFDLVPSLFNRLLIFDDRAPHAVRRVQGTLNPLDSRFVMHGHLEEPGHIAWVTGGLNGVDLQPQWQRMNLEIAPIMQSYDYHGFITVEMTADTLGKTKNVTLKHVQLLPLKTHAVPLEPCLEEIVEKLSDIDWPEAPIPSTLVLAICSNSLR